MYIFDSKDEILGMVIWVDNDGNIMYSKLYERFGNDEVDKKS